MAIRDRDRKVLWSRAGNCCSLCRTLLVREGEVGRGLTVIGEECHIVSPAPGGPRAGVPVKELDGYANLVLLCPNDHRLIDTLVADYPVERLQSIKRAHEEWVSSKISASDGPTPLTILRAEPAALHLLPTAQDVLNVATSAEESSLDHEELRNQDDVDTVAGFLQYVHDTAEIWDDLEPADRIRATFDLDRELESLKAAGWLVFGARARGKLRGGVLGADTDWETAYLRLVRTDSPDIVRLGSDADPNRETPNALRP